MGDSGESGGGFAFLAVLAPDGTLVEATGKAPGAGAPPEQDRGGKLWTCTWWAAGDEVKERLRQGCERAATGEDVRFGAIVRTAGETLGQVVFEIRPLWNTQGRITHLIASALGGDGGRWQAAGEPARQAEERFGRLVEAIREGFAHYQAIHDERGRLVDLLVLDINPAGARLSGVPPEDQVGRTWRQVWPGVDERLFDRYREAEASGEPVRFEDNNPLTGRVYDVVINPAGRGEFAVTFYDVTERTRAEAALAENEERLRLALAAADLGVWELDLKTDTAVRSPRHDQIFGYDEPQPAWGLEIALRHLLPEDRPGAIEAHARAAKTGELAHQSRVVWPDGSVHWIDARGRVHFDDEGKPARVAGVVADITERKRAEELLRESEERYRTLFDSIDEGYCIIEMRIEPGEPLDYRFLEVNEAFERQSTLVGATGRWMRELRPEHEESWFEIYRDVALTGRPVRFEQSGRALGDRWFSLYAFRIGRPEQRRVAVLFNDITAQKRAEEALRRSNEQLERMARTLEERVQERTAEAERRFAQVRLLHAELSSAEQRQRQHFAVLLHDGLQQLLVAGKIRLSLARRTADEATDALLAEVRTLLDESLEAARTLTLELAPPLLYDRGLVPALHVLARQMEEKQRLRVEVRAVDSAEPPAADVRLLLYQATRELLFNVVKHAGARAAVVTLERSDHRLCLAVSDRGRGFDAAVRREGGDRPAGFGLVRVQQRVEWLGGSMEIESATGRGTTVSLQVPITVPESAVAPPPAARTEAARPRPAPADRPGLRRIRVLLADDHRIVREGLTSLLLAQPDLEVVGQAADGEEAVSLAREHRPDVVVMDLSMPRVDGIEATRRIRAELPEVRVIGLSMYDGGEVAEAMRGAGAVGYVRKGGPTDDLVDLIREHGRR